MESFRAPASGKICRVVPAELAFRIVLAAPVFCLKRLNALNFTKWHGGCNESCAVRLGERAAAFDNDG
jgi:hypothetical protein